MAKKINWSFLEPISRTKKISPVEIAGELFKKSLVVAEVAKELDIDITQARFLVQEYFGEKSVVKCRRKAEKELGIDFSKIHATPEKMERIKETYKLYNQLGTLDKTSKVLKVSRERVRQILTMGNYYGLFKYDRLIERRIKREEHLKSISKEQVIESLTKGGIPAICEDLSITFKEAHQLLDKHKLNAHKVFVEIRKKNIIFEYENIVNEIGRHPSTTDLQHSGRVDWRAFDTFVRTYFGGLINFRKENGIEYTHVKRLHFASQEKKIREFFAHHWRFKRVDLQKFLGVSPGTTCKILNKLIRKNEVKVIPSLSKKFYTYEFTGVS